MLDSKLVTIHENTTIVVRILQLLRGGYRIQQTHFQGRYIDRFLWPMVVRGKEEHGVKFLNVGISAHKQILGYIIDNQVAPKLTFWQKVRCNLSKCRPFGWFRFFGLKDDHMEYCSLPLTILYSLFEWTPLKFVMRNPPPHDNVVNLDTGYDLKITKTHQSTSGGYKLPIYQCDWIETSKSAGTPQQIEAWKQECEHLFANFKEAFNGDETNKASYSGNCS